MDLFPIIISSIALLLAIAAIIFARRKPECDCECDCKRYKFDFEKTTIITSQIADNEEKTFIGVTEIPKPWKETGRVEVITGVEVTEID